MRIVNRRAAGFAALAATTAVATALSATVAVASPPVLLITKVADLARAQMLEGGMAATPAGTDAVSSTYVLAPGSGSGWRTEPGTSVFAVTKGALTLSTAVGCATKQYRAGQAALVPAGTYQVANEGSDAVEFAGVFLKLAPGAAKPLVDGAAGPAPAACKGAADAAAGTATASLADYVRGTMVPIAAYGASLHAMGAHGITVESDKDMLVSSYEGLPGFNSGWITHLPALTFVTHGTLTYYEGRDGKCVVSEKYGPGQAFTHVGGLHMAVNEGTEPVDFTIVYFNLPHGSPASFFPALGTADAVDFTPLPPTDCPRLS